MVFIRSLEKIDSLEKINASDLVLTDIIPIPITLSWRDWLFKRKQATLWSEFLYTLKDPTSRVFTIPKSLFAKINLPFSQNNEAILLEQITPINRKNVNLDEYYPSYIKFHGNFAESECILASINYHKEWKLLIDGFLAPDRLRQGPFGSLQISPLSGNHVYELVFPSPFIKILFCIGIAMVLLFFTVKRN